MTSGTLFQLCVWWRDIERGAANANDAMHSSYYKQRMAAIKLALFREIQILESQGGPTNDDTSVRHGDERAPPGA